MLVGGVSVVCVAISRWQQGGKAGVVGGCLMILLGALGIAPAVRPETLTVDDGGLHLRYLFGVRVIPWYLVRSFRAGGGNGRWAVRVELGTGRQVMLPALQGSRGRAERMADELTAAHREYLADGGD